MPFPPRRPVASATAAALLASAAMPAAAQEVVYEAQGRTLTGYFASADAEVDPAVDEGPRGLVIIAHDWDGLTEYERQRADMLAEEGYDAFALDMFGADVPTQTVEHRKAATGALYADRDAMRALIEAGLAEARDLSGAEGMVVMGYCFGGAVALEMARSGMADRAAGYATFHGGLATPEGQGWDGDEPPLRIFHGGADASITMDDVAAFAKELEAVGGDYRIEVYSGAPHAFTVFGTDRYRERADLESWDAFMAFLHARLGR